MSVTLHTSKFDLPPHGTRTPDTILFGDETFLISVFASRFCVWCFDGNVPIFTEKIACKEKCKSELERLLHIKETRKNTSFDD